MLGLSQIDLSTNQQKTFSGLLPEKLRLGHVVEHFVFNELNTDYTIDLLVKNIQIKRDKVTIGEIDCLLKHNHTPIHLEIIYKFYLYDESVGNSELEHWIGPNRKDSLIEKITKLKNKQLPLLYKTETVPIILEQNLNIVDIQQQVYFKAQLFVPYTMLGHSLRLINNKCIKGYYLHFKELNSLNEYQFHIPIKLDWLTEPNHDVEWLVFDTATTIIQTSITQERAPLCWIKSKNGDLQKIFVVWW